MSTDQQEMSVSIDVAASPEIVWDLIADLAEMGEWSPECTGVKWAGGAPGPAGPSVGAVFKGSNKIGFRRWSTKGTIVAAEPNRRIAWDVAALGLPVARWSYSIGPSDGGCRVTETWQDKRGAIINALGPLTTGVKDRAAHNEAGMRTTLERLKAAAEARAK
jgi:uncharacterized protein YndB with AHSA1/START domain